MMLAVASLAIGAVTAMVTPSAHADPLPAGDDAANTLVHPDEVIEPGLASATSALHNLDTVNPHINSDSTTNDHLH